MIGIDKAKLKIKTSKENIRRQKGGSCRRIAFWGSDELKIFYVKTAKITALLFQYWWLFDVLVVNDAKIELSLPILIHNFKW